MSDLQSLPELVAIAQANAKTSEDSSTGSEAATVLELAAVDIFTLFEARMQHHFKRGPFSRKLQSSLMAAGHVDLADRVYQHYLAINVLKHGKGASYRELLGIQNCLFVVKPNEKSNADDETAAAHLINVTVPGFFDRLTETILEAYDFLENKKP